MGHQGFIGQKPKENNNSETYFGAARKPISDHPLDHQGTTKGQPRVKLEFANWFHLGSHLGSFGVHRVFLCPLWSSLVLLGPLVLGPLGSSWVPLGPLRFRKHFPSGFTAPRKSMCLKHVFGDPKNSSQLGTAVNLDKKYPELRRPLVKGLLNSKKGSSQLMPLVVLQRFAR